MLTREHRKNVSPEAADPSGVNSIHHLIRPRLDMAPLYDIEAQAPKTSILNGQATTATISSHRQLQVFKTRCAHAMPRPLWACWGVALSSSDVSA